MSKEPSYFIFTREESGLPKILQLAEHKIGEPNLQFVVIARLPFKTLNNGLPAQGELSRLSLIEDKLIKEFIPTGAIHLGHITFNGVMQVVFQSIAPLPPEITIKTGLLSKQVIPLDVRRDPNWSWYYSEMAPTPVEREWARNQQLFETLRKHNDHHATPRQVDFWAYFATAEERAKFLDAVTSQGYSLTSESTAPTPSPLPFGCEFAIVTGIEPHAIAERCAALRAETDRLNGDFDGWACPVITS